MALEHFPALISRQTATEKPRDLFPSSFLFSGGLAPSGPAYLADPHLAKAIAIYPM